MSNDRYRFKLGDFECLAILDTTYTGGNAEFFFPNVSHASLQAAHIDPYAIQFPGICLAIHTGTDWALLDAGIGFFKEGARLAQILEEENIQPHHIILTHPDADHYGGLINSDHTPAFPNARVYMCRDEWAGFTSDIFYETSKRPFVIKEHLLQIEEQIELVDYGDEILPGFRLIALPGHTPHHVGIAIESNGEKLLYAGDVVCHPLHIEHLDWQFGGDSDHKTAYESRIKLARMAATSGCLILADHFNFPGLGHIVQSDDGWQWQPLKGV